MTEVVFISHTDAAASIALEGILRSAFPGELSVFNTSQTASGLAAGESINQGVLDHIRGAKVMIWLASPESVAKSFWMAWELGAATAAGTPVVPACCLGLRPVDLPLLQSGRMAPDIGTREGLNQLLLTLRSTLQPATNQIAEALDLVFADDRTPSPLWGEVAEDRIEVTRLGGRLLVENKSDETLAVHSVEGAGIDASDARRLLRSIKNLRATERAIVETVPDSFDKGAIVQFKWSLGTGARQWADIEIEEG